MHTNVLMTEDEFEEIISPMAAVHYERSPSEKTVKALEAYYQEVKFFTPNTFLKVMSEIRSSYKVTKDWPTPAGLKSICHSKIKQGRPEENKNYSQCYTPGALKAMKKFFTEQAERYDKHLKEFPVIEGRSATMPFCFGRMAHQISQGWLPREERRRID